MSLWAPRDAHTRHASARCAARGEAVCPPRCAAAPSRNSIAPRHLVARQPLPTEGDQVLGRGEAPARLTTTPAHGRPHSASATPTTPASSTAWMREQRRLDFGRVDVLAARDDQVVAPIEHVQVAVGVQIAQVAGVQPAVARRADAGSPGLTLGPRTQISPSAAIRIWSPSAACPPSRAFSPRPRAPGSRPARPSRSGRRSARPAHALRAARSSSGSGAGPPPSSTHRSVDGYGRVAAFGQHAIEHRAHDRDDRDAVLVDGAVDRGGVEARRARQRSCRRSRCAAGSTARRRGTAAGRPASVSSAPSPRFSAEAIALHQWLP